MSVFDDKNSNSNNRNEEKPLFRTSKNEQPIFKTSSLLRKKPLEEIINSQEAKEANNGIAKSENKPVQANSEVPLFKRATPNNEQNNITPKNNALNSDNSLEDILKSINSAPTKSAIDRRSQGNNRNRTIGSVISCNGSNVIIKADASTENLHNFDSWSVGQMISINNGQGRIVVLVREMKAFEGTWHEKEDNMLHISADILGEVYENNDGDLKFKRGLTRYPPVGAVAHKIRTSDLEVIFDLGDRNGVEIGSLTQNDDISAMVAVDDILKRHFAIVGTTGVGKSCAVSLLVLKAIEADKNLRVIMLDPHNEFAGAFGDKVNLLDQNNLDLPFWILNYDEFEDIIFRGKTIPAESDILRELVLNAKIERVANNGSIVKRSEAFAINVDTPVPYRTSDIIKQIDYILGQLEPRFNRMLLRSLKVRIEMIENNPRYSFMFGRNDCTDNFSQIIANMFRIPANGKPMTTINLSGLPSEVINCVASVTARLAFDVASASCGAMKVLLVCEEAHRYVPHDTGLGFAPTRRSIARIAKEGRKYNCAIAVVTQRPGELDPTILSQCSTVFAMRLSNDRDQEIIRSALSDSSSGIISFLSSLDNREAIAFGEGVSVPMRLKFLDHDLAKLREESGINFTKNKTSDCDDLKSDDIILAMRGMKAQLVEDIKNIGLKYNTEELRRSTDFIPTPNNSPKSANNNPIRGDLFGKR